MTKKQRELLDAIMAEFDRIDKSDDFLYLKKCRLIDCALDLYSRDLDKADSFDDIDFIRSCWMSVINNHRASRRTTKLSKFFQECPFKNDFKRTLRDLYVSVRSGDPVKTDFDFNVMRLRLVLFHLSKF